MSKIILGRKLGVTRQLSGNNAGVLTVIKIDPNTIVDIKTMSKDGYSAIVLSTGHKKSLNKPQKGQLKGLDLSPQKTSEFRMAEEITEKIGDTVGAETFAEGDKVIVSARAKGKGFAGTIKRHGFHRGPTTHGSDQHRAPGSIGSAYPQRVFKGKKMAGRLGGAQAVCQAVVHDVIKEDQLLILKGTVPGPKGTWLKIYAI